MSTDKADSKLLRAAGYCRTSGEGQRDNTSIPSQKQDIELLSTQSGWQHIHHYVDESKTGSKIAGRDAFQQMMRDAANNKFDVVVVYDISRFARDGFDILESARTLNREYGIHVVDTKGQFDTRNPRRVLNNYIFAGVAEDERLRIMERTARGRIARAKEGRPWSGTPPVGRAYDKDKKEWYVTDKGKAIADLLRRYLDGEGTSRLARGMGVNPSKISEWVHHGNLASPCKVRFRFPDLCIDEYAEVPGLPEVVSSDILERVKTRLTFNRRNNRTDVKKYYLGGFLRCACCGRAFTGCNPRDARKKYRHAKTGPDCPFKSVDCEELESNVLNHLYSFFLDEPAFDAAVQRAAPSTNDRKNIEDQLTQTDKRLGAITRKINNLAIAIGEGADPMLLIEHQNQLKTETKSLTDTKEELTNRLDSMPSVEHTKQAAMLIRLRLAMAYTGRNWRELPFEEIRAFLFYLFGENPLKSKTGILIGKNSNGQMVVTFKGRVDFYHLLVEGREQPLHMIQMAENYNNAMKGEYQRAVAVATARFQAETARQQARTAMLQAVKPFTAYKYAG